MKLNAERMSLADRGFTLTPVSAYNLSDLFNRRFGFCFRVFTVIFALRTEPFADFFDDVRGDVDPLVFQDVADLCRCVAV